MRLIPTLALTLSIGQGFLTGDFKTDMYKLRNCSLLESLINRRFEFKGTLTPYEQKLLKFTIPWYKKNCT